MDIPLPRFLLRFLSHLRQVFDIPSWLRIANRYPTIELQKNQILSIRWRKLRTLHYQANTHFSMLRLFAKIKNRLQLGLLNKFSHKYIKCYVLPLIYTMYLHWNQQNLPQSWEKEIPWNYRLR